MRGEQWRVISFPRIAAWHKEERLSCFFTDHNQMVFVPLERLAISIMLNGKRY